MDERSLAIENGKIPAGIFIWWEEGVHIISLFPSSTENSTPLCFRYLRNISEL